ncbi:hypothetical protein Pint_17515 [Pistacia integerrima]|uniref:Uncharacterized protein n=1 Tax=Pistacia integerrima TaxID=434235 RepID=A0ACC0YY22_9ROSI|nr:hypothetical protein Pint_17515 [Pistacia integerrima]
MKYTQGYSADAKKMYEEASQVANDAIGSIRTVASFCAEEKVMEIYQKKCEDPLKASIKQGLAADLIPISLHAATPHQTPTNQTRIVFSIPRQMPPRLARCRDASPAADKPKTNHHFHASLEAITSHQTNQNRHFHASPCQMPIPEAAHFKALGSTVEEAIMDLVLLVEYLWIVGEL